MPDLSHYIGNNSEFPILRGWDFFNHAGVAPISFAAAEAMRVFVGQAATASYLLANWYGDIEKLRESAAAMIHADRDEIAFIKNTSEGLCTVARGVRWRKGDRIISTGVEYPANIYPWMDAAQNHGAEFVMVAEEAGADGRRRVPIDRILEAAAEPQTRMVTLSHVEFASGQRHDLARIGAFCRERNILFCVDAIQSLGIIPIDVRAMKIDYLAADGHKWMLGPEGAGIFYCRRELIEQTHPLVVGWMNVVDAMNFGQYNYALRPDAGRFESGSHNVAGLLGLRASVELFNSLTVEAISARIKHLTDYLIAVLEKKGYPIVSPRGPEEWSGIVSFTSPTHALDPIPAALRKEHRIEIALREGRLRVSPHFYNTEAQLERLVKMLPDH